MHFQILIAARYRQCLCYHIRRVMYPNVLFSFGTQGVQWQSLSILPFLDDWLLCRQYHWDKINQTNVLILHIEMLWLNLIKKELLPHCSPLLQGLANLQAGSLAKVEIDLFANNMQLTVQCGSWTGQRKTLWFRMFWCRVVEIYSCLIFSPS